MTTQEKIEAYGEYEEGVPNLSPAQIDRQDYVDNKIFNLIRELAGDDIDEPFKDGGVEWDISVIAEVREVIQDYLLKRNLTTEMDFYPYIETEEE